MFSATHEGHSVVALNFVLEFGYDYKNNNTLFCRKFATFNQASLQVTTYLALAREKTYLFICSFTFLFIYLLVCLFVFS